MTPLAPGARFTLNGNVYAVLSIDYEARKIALERQMEPWSQEIPRLEEAVVVYVEPSTDPVVEERIGGLGIAKVFTARLTDIIDEKRWARAYYVLTGIVGGTA